LILKVSLSETSLDVFQLLLQLSDTMLDLNNQFNTSVNANQYFLSSNGNKFNINNLLMMSSANIYEEDEAEGSQQHQLQQNGEQILSSKTTPLTCNTFMNHTDAHIQANRPFSPNPNKPNTPNTITNIINSINSKIQSSHSGPLSPVSVPNKVKRNSSVFNKTPSSTTHENKFFDNIYDKASVSQFVDSLFSNNNKSNHFINEEPSMQSFLTTESNYYSSLADEDGDNQGVVLEQDELMMVVNSSKTPKSLHHNSSNSNNNNSHLSNSISHSSDIAFMNNTSPNSHLPPHSTSKSHFNTNGSLSSLNHQQQSSSLGSSASSAQVKKRISTTTSTTNQILARQTSNTLNANKQFNSLNQPSRNGKQSTLVKSSTSSTSSSGCGGSSSLSSNIDLSSLPSTCSSFINMNDEQQLLSKQVENVNRRSLSSVKSSSSGCSSGESNINTNVANADNSLKQLNRHSTVSNCSSKSINNSIASSAEQRIIDQIDDYELNQASQSPKSPTGSVAGLAAAYLSNRSNSVNYKNSNHASIVTKNSTSTTAPCHLTHSASIAYRKPSFKFESNIFSRVQNMNISKVKCLDPNGKLLDENETTKGQSDFKSIISSNNLATMNGDNLKRHKLIINKFNENNQVHNVIKSNHQISLDSGIYLPSESEDNNSFNLNIVK
jgi:hypothetical protein